MTRSPLWREFESGNSAPLKALRYLILAAGLFFLVFTGILELTWPQQTVLGLLTVLVAMWMDRSSSSYLLTLTLMLVSCFSTFRYGYWRLAHRRILYLAPGPGRVLCLHHSLSGLHADSLASAPHAGFAAGRS